MLFTRLNQWCKLGGERFGMAERETSSRNYQSVEDLACVEEIFDWKCPSWMVGEGEAPFNLMLWDCGWF